MSYVPDLDYSTLISPRRDEPPAFNLFRKRVSHWRQMLDWQHDAFDRENARLSTAGGEIAWTIDFSLVDSIRERCLDKGKFYPEAFDASGKNRLAKIGKLNLQRPGGVLSQWVFYTGLIMSRNLALNPSFYLRLEPTKGKVSNEIKWPSLALVPDQIGFSPEWRLLEGNQQDVYAVAIFSAYNFSTRPSCQEIAQGLIAVLLSTLQP